MFEHDEHGSTQAERQRQQARAGEPRRIAKGASSALPVEHDLVVQRRRDEKADAQKHQSEPYAVQSLACRWDVPEELLKNGLALTGVKGDATIIVIGVVLIASTLIASSLQRRR